jgi:hypothetical protein
MATMPRLIGTSKQRDLFSRRWRTVAAPPPKEHQIQIAIMEHFRWRKHRYVIGFHVPNGEIRDKSVAAKLKAMGVLPGVHDLVFLWGEGNPVAGTITPRGLFLEVKAAGGKRSAAQLDFAVAVKAMGYFCEVCDNVDDGVRILLSYGLLAK